ncbi:MAG: hypothetical protein LBM70_07640 [Victivallales bacterium]|jgi:hypothetical protein|nr:hypothetical protein [Victivallales bacterium]
MAKNDYVSDNLLHMREILQENTARIAANSRGDSPNDNIAEPSPKLSDKTLVIRKNTSRNDELDRQRRDFEYRLLRDRAAIAAELELESQKIAELENFSKTLDQLNAEFSRQEFSESSDCQRELEKLRFGYFRAAGRVAPFRKEQANVFSSSSDGKNHAATGAKTGLLAIAVVIGALIIAGTLLGLFY